LPRYRQGAHEILLTCSLYGAFDATQTGDVNALLHSLVEAGRAFDGRVDAVLLAQYSLAPAANALSAELGLPVISGPDAAAVALRARILAPTEAGVKR
jgi:hypothetical protein